MSGQVITVVYMSDPIILRYCVFSKGVSNVGDVEWESGVKSIPGSNGVMADLQSSNPNHMIICSIYDSWEREIVRFCISRDIDTPSNQFIGPKSENFQNSLSSRLKALTVPSESATMVKSSVATPTSVAAAQSWHFAILVNKLGKIPKIFEQLDHL